MVSRYRISHFSLPAPDSRGVMDACLLNDNTAVVGYSAGPTQPQVSVLILDAEQVWNFNVSSNAPDVSNIGANRHHDVLSLHIGVIQR